MILQVEDEMRPQRMCMHSSFSEIRNQPSLTFYLLHVLASCLFFHLLIARFFSAGISSTRARIAKSAGALLSVQMVIHLKGRAGMRSDVSPSAIGTLTTGKHNRYVRSYHLSLTPAAQQTFHRMILANTEELHDKIEDLLDRIRVLEEALRSLQASVSTQPHPLLAHLPTDAPPSSPALRLPSPRPEPEEQDNSEANHSSETPPSPEADDISSLDALGG